MKKLLILVFLFISLFSFSQARLGYSYQEIKREFVNENVVFTYVDSTPCLIITYLNIEVYYYFNDKFLCYQTCVVTEDFSTAKEIVNTYNKNYDYVSKNTWSMKMNNLIFIVKLSYIKDVGYVFTWN